MKHLACILMGVILGLILFYTIPAQGLEKPRCYYERDNTGKNVLTCPPASKKKQASPNGKESGPGQLFDRKNDRILKNYKVRRPQGL